MKGKFAPIFGEDFMTPEELLFPNLLKVQEIFIKILNSNKAVDVYKTINYYDYAFILLNYFAADIMVIPNLGSTRNINGHDNS
ncbi:hypothetical protein O9G_005118 [Rozella allomycis CSF55]|uniref:Uncharacterized protein n=1 Tax=Rozella allomycis (strain CSF55) TaxID=988480 RepID=A0A075AZ58_ROZAC|nr:hypothetical protein O9G_005118 [Rozella allomycis CSF55]|eukprot:EPZ33997.1 hypothetical protein O9G_005118 [Rozella allomycis CSF55]